jgi:hypothetical protein
MSGSRCARREEPVLPGELHDPARDRQIGVGAVQVELPERHVAVPAQAVLDVPQHALVLRPGADVPARAVGTERRDDQVRRLRQEALGAVVVGARHEGPPHARLAQDGHRLGGRHHAPGVVAVVDVGVEDRELGRGRRGHGEQQREQQGPQHGRHLGRRWGRPIVRRAPGAAGVSGGRRPRRRTGGACGPPGPRRASAVLAATGRRSRTAQAASARGWDRRRRSHRGAGTIRRRPAGPCGLRG